MENSTVTFPELRGLMAKYGMDRQKMAEVIGGAYQTFNRKLNCEYDFSMTEMMKIRAFFIDLGEKPYELSMERLFFAWKLHKSDE